MLSYFLSLKVSPEILLVSLFQHNKQAPVIKELESRILVKPVMILFV